MTVLLFQLSTTKGAYHFADGHFSFHIPDPTDSNSPPQTERGAQRHTSACPHQR